MSKRRVTTAVAALGFAAVGALSAGQQAATADAAPQAHDVVGVGSDVIQNSVDFLADGSPFGDPGYNSAGNLHRVFNFDATPDANGRLPYTDPALGTSALQNPSVVLRAGQSPEKRPNGGSAGINAILADTHHAIDYVRSPNLPTASNQTAAVQNLGSNLHVIQFAEDAQYIATTPAGSTHAPAGLSTEALAAIYCKNFTPANGDAYSAFGPTHHITTWNQIPGNESGQTSTIVALRPQDGAGVLKPFQSALGAYTSDKCVTWNDGTSDSVAVTPVQQNDPTTITGNANKDDAIVPFPLSRFKLLSNNYFPDPNNASYKGGFPANDANGKTSVPLSAAGITLQIPSGKPGAGAYGTTVSAGYYAKLPFYILFRDTDAADSNAWQPGGTLNWVNELFYNADYRAGSATGAPAPFFASPAAQALIEGLGLTFKYADLGIASAG